MKLLIALLLVGCVSMAAAQEKSCDVLTREAEEGVRKIFVIEGNKTPTAAEVKARCE